VLIMDVVRQVVRAAQDHIHSERASTAGNISYFAWCLRVAGSTEVLFQSDVERGAAELPTWRTSTTCTVSTTFDFLINVK